MNIISDFLFWILSLFIPLGLIVIMLSTKDRETKNIAKYVLITISIIWVILAFINKGLE